tara:strand:+ start:265 stop:414 length:150 start_codon:yes stop_codon:yes gene_type:complete
MKKNSIICTVKDLPIIIAGFVREGVTFEVMQTNHHYCDNAYEIVLTGGY